MTKKLRPDQRVVRAAARRHGLITRQQALACGLSDRQITGRLRSGRWERLHPGVYRIAGAPDSPEQTAHAAALAAGPVARVGGLSALALLGVCDAPPVPTIVLPPTGNGRAPALVRRSPLTRLDCTSVGPIPCTSPARALLEAAPRVPDELLEDLVDTVLTKGITTPSSILNVVRRAPSGHGRAGSIRLRAALAPWIEGIRPGSPGEVRLIRRIDEWGFPTPVRQHEVVLPNGRRVFVDLAWPGHLAGLEYDGEAHHGPRRLAADEAREQALRALGWWIGRADRHDLRPSSTRLRDELAPHLLFAAA